MKDFSTQEQLKSFWEERANKLKWFKKWDDVCAGENYDTRWFVNGKLNASCLCLDRYIGTEIENKIAIHWECEDGQKQSFTYKQLYLEVNKFASSLKKLGLKKGDRVILYLPMIPQAVVSMLAVARLGAIHSVVFSGFSSKALEDRIHDTKARFVISADFGIRRGKKIFLKNIVDQALENVDCVEKVIFIKRFESDINLKKDRDVLYNDLIKNGDDYIKPEEMDSNDPLFILYTSGTTGKPKGIVHSTGGYSVYAHTTFEECFDIKKDSIYWCTADLGWITGHSYVLYAPFMHGVTQVIYEGAPDYPAPSIWWQIIQDYKVSIFYTSPTAIRMFMGLDKKWIEGYDLKSLKVLGSVGEPINPKAWEWFFKNVGNQNCPIIDTWWQTETGGFMMAPTKSFKISDLKPGSVTFPLPGVDADIVDKDGKYLTSGNKGYLIIKKSWPGIALGIFNDKKRYVDTYWTKFKNYFYAGDYAIKDKDNYFWVLGRADETLNIAGHRVGTIEIENAVICNKDVAEVAAIGVSDQIKGESFILFVVVKNEIDEFDCKKDIIGTIRNQIGSLVKPKEIYFVKSLPKTRSGKILRRVLKNIILENDAGDITTLEEKGILTDIKEKILG